MTFANLRLSGKMPVVSDWFTVVVTAFNKSNLADCIKKVNIGPIVYTCTVYMRNIINFLKNGVFGN